MEQGGYTITLTSGFPKTSTNCTANTLGLGLGLIRQW